MSSSSCQSRRESQGRKDILILIIPLIRYSAVFSERSEDFWQGSTNLLHQPAQQSIRSDVRPFSQMRDGGLHKMTQLKAASLSQSGPQADRTQNLRNEIVPKQGLLKKPHPWCNHGFPMVCKNLPRLYHRLVKRGQPS